MLPSATRLFRLAAPLVAVALLPALSLAAELDGRVRMAANAAKLRADQFAVHIVDLSSGETLAAFDAGREMIPASNQKLLASGAALLTLGCDFEFRTRVSVLDNAVIVTGAGDPALADSALLEQLQPTVTVEDVLGGLATAIVGAGLDNIDEIVIDDRVFDRERVHPSWPKDQLNRWYCAEVDGLTFHNNVLRIYPQPSPDGPGSAPVILRQPEAPWMDVRVNARTVATGRNTVWVARSLTSNRFTVMGDVRHRAEIDVSVHEPSLWFGSLLANRVRAQGATVGGKGKTAFGAGRFDAVRLVEPAEDLSGGRVIAEISTPITEVVERCNKASYNLYADCLLKRIGHEITGEPGSWGNGATVVRMLLGEHLGADVAAETIVADGSGMSRVNRIAPSTLTAWLEMMAESEVADCFIASLPAVGEGSLRNRFKLDRPEGEVRAKSGTLSGVRCLSGYAIDPVTGRKVAFSVLVNNLGNGSESRSAKLFHEKVALICDQWLIGQREEARVGG